MNKLLRSMVPLALSAALAGAACGKPEHALPFGATASTTGSAAAHSDVFVTVNGVAIGDADVKLKLKSDMHSTDESPLHRKNAAESIIRQELVRQKAVALGLDSDPVYQGKLRQMEAQMLAFQRAELGEVFFRREIVAKAEVSDADAKAYFDANAKRIRTDLHVLQLLRINDDAGLERDLKDIQKGTPFEEVAKRQFPGLPESQKPWDLGSMKWAQIPEAWRSVLDGLEPGQTSGLIRGPKNRSWIIKLVDKRVDESVTFESMKGAVVETMRSAKIEKLRSDFERELREKATIVFAKPDAATPAPAASPEL